MSTAGSDSGWYTPFTHRPALIGQKRSLSLITRVSRQRTFEYAFVVTSSNSPATVAALVDSLRYDPFYGTITEEFADNQARRRQALARYFSYSMSEGGRMGRLVVWPDPAVGAAVWLLPAQTSVHDAEARAKAEFLAAALGATGRDAYRLIIDFMRPRAAAVVSHAEPVTGATYTIMLRNPKSRSAHS